MKTVVQTLSLLAFALPALTASAQEYRTFDGSGNNLANPTYGQSGETLARLAPANYFDGISTIDPSLPNPRDISNVIFDQTVSSPDQRGLSE